MAESLNDVKRRLGRRFLGKAGIHGLGISRAQNAIRIYLQPEPTLEEKAVLEEIEKAAEPYTLLLEREAPPVAT